MRRLPQCRGNEIAVAHLPRRQRVRVSQVSEHAPLPGGEHGIPVAIFNGFNDRGGVRCSVVLPLRIVDGQRHEPIEDPPPARTMDVPDGVRRAAGRVHERRR